MASKTVETFTQALQRLEESGQVDDLLTLFTEDCELENLAATTPVKGRDSAHQFWKNYYAAFQQIQSEFTRVLEGENLAVLEWTARGTLADGSPIEYRGVSILELAGEQVRRFQTYYDTGAFFKKHTQAAHHTAGGGSNAQVVS